MIIAVCVILVVVTARESTIPVVISSTLSVLAVIIITALVTVAVAYVVYTMTHKKLSDNKVNSIPVNHHSSDFVSVEEKVRNNTLLCVHQSPDVIAEDNNQERNEEVEYATISHEKTRPKKEKCTESDYISPNIMLGDPHLNSSPQQVTLFGGSNSEASNNHEYVV